MESSFSQSFNDDSPVNNRNYNDPFFPCFPNYNNLSSNPTNDLHFNPNARQITSYWSRTLILHSHRRRRRRREHIPSYHLLPISQMTVVNINLQNNHPPILLQNINAAATSSVSSRRPADFLHNSHSQFNTTHQMISTALIHNQGNSSQSQSHARQSTNHPLSLSDMHTLMKQKHQCSQTVPPLKMKQIVKHDQSSCTHVDDDHSRPSADDDDLESNMITGGCAGVLKLGPPESASISRPKHQSQSSRPNDNQLDDDDIAQEHPEHAIRHRSHPYVKYGPYTCPKCENQFKTSQSFAAHTAIHYMGEQLDEKKKRRELKCRKRDLCIIQSDEGVTLAPRSLVIKPDS
ncbi:hypothetical protein Dimus_011675 [Dionaea muscipula]